MHAFFAAYRGRSQASRAESKVSNEFHRSVRERFVSRESMYYDASVSDKTVMKKKKKKKKVQRSCAFATSLANELIKNRSSETLNRRSLSARSCNRSPIKRLMGRDLATLARRASFDSRSSWSSSPMEIDIVQFQRISPILPRTVRLARTVLREIQSSRRFAFAQQNKTRARDGATTRYVRYSGLIELSLL